MTGFFPFSDKIATGSFDKTCKLWSTETGKCYHTFRGHSAEIVSTDGHFSFLCFLTPSLMPVGSKSLRADIEGVAILLHLFTHSDIVNISALQEKIV